MNLSRVRFAARTLLGPWLVVPAIGLHVANLMQRGRPWEGETMLTLEWMAIAMFVLGPIVCGVAAVDAARLARPTAAYLTVPTRRPRMAFGRAALWAALPLIGLQVITYVVALVVGDSPLTTAVRPDMLLALLVQCAAIGWYVALGSLIGRFCPPILAGVVGTVVAFFLFYALSGSSSGSSEFSLLNLGGATVTQIGRRYSSAYLLVQLLLLIGTALAMFLVRLHFRQGRAIPTAVGGAIVVGIIAATASGGLAGAEERKTLVAPTPPERCYEWTPTICVYEYHGTYAEEAVIRIKGLLDATAAAGYDALVPARIEQRSYNYIASDPSVATFFLDPGDLGVPNWTQEVAMTNLLTPNCPQLRTEQGPPMAYFENFAKILSTWSLAAGLPDIFGNYLSLDDAMTPDEVAEVLGRWRSCELG